MSTEKRQNEVMLKALTEMGAGVDELGAICACDDCVTNAFFKAVDEVGKLKKALKLVATVGKMVLERAELAEGVCKALDSYGEKSPEFTKAHAAWVAKEPS